MKTYIQPKTNITELQLRNTLLTLSVHNEKVVGDTYSREDNAWDEWDED